METLATTCIVVPRSQPEQVTLTHPGWVGLHIVLLLASYIALIVSLGASVLYFAQERRIKAKRPTFPGLPSLEAADQIAAKALLLGMPCISGGLLIGSALAAETVGPRFFLDPKVLLSFGLWIVYAWMIYVRRHAGLRGRRAAYLSSIVLFVVFAVWVANQLSAVHRFAVP